MKTSLQALSLLIGLPAIAIGLFITHEILQAIEADRLLWFLFWIYVPAVILTSLISKAAERAGK